MAFPNPTAARLSVVLLLALAAVEGALLVEAGTWPTFASWWSSVGLAVALVAVTPVRRWPLAIVSILTAVAVVHLAYGDAPGTVVAEAVTRSLQAVVGALILTRGGRCTAKLVTQRDLVGVLAAAAACGVIAVGEVVLRASSSVPGYQALVEVGAQHAASTLLLCSVTLLAPGIRILPGRAPELVLQLVVLSVVMGVVFAPGQELPLTFAAMPVLVWAALRFDSGIAAVELVAFAVAVGLPTSRGAGPIALAGLDRDVTGSVVLAYVVSMALVTLPLALTVSQRLRLLDRVSADEHLFRRNFTESPLGMVLLRHEGGELIVDELNGSASTILAAPHDDVVGRRLHDVLDALDPTDRGFYELLSGTIDTWHGQVVALGRPGSRLEVAVAALDWRDGARIYSGQLLDVTQTHEAHRRLVAANRLSDATLDTTACIIMVTDASGTVVRVNAATLQITGFMADELVGRDLWSTPIGALSRSETEAMFLWPNRSGYPMVSERRTRTARGMPLRIVWSNNVVLDEQGQPSHAVLAGIDVTSERNSTGLIAHLLSASIATALVGVDSAGHITLFNAGAAHMLGWTAEEMLGRAFVDLFDQAQLHHRTGALGDHQPFLSLVGLMGDRDESLARDWTWQTRDGHDLIVSMTLSVTEDLGDGQVQFLCVGRDVTEQREAEETLVAALDKERTALERLQQLDRAKDDFVSTVSHELRTPVTSIIGYTEMLRDGNLVEPSPEQVPLLDTIARNSQRLVTICNDLLVLSGFEADATSGVRTRVDLRSCVIAAAEALSVPPHEHGVTILVEAGTSAVEVTGDQEQLDRLVANLLGNAVKFTPAGGRVSVSLDHDGNRALLTVSDTGIGIPARDHEAVFQRFYRSEEAQVRAIPGTGLGLSIIAAIVKAHEGEIGLESEPGRGTTFRVAIPLRLEASRADLEAKEIRQISSSG